MFSPDTFRVNISFPITKVSSLPAIQFISGQCCFFKMAVFHAVLFSDFHLSCGWLRASLACHMTSQAVRYWLGAAICLQCHLWV